MLFLCEHALENNELPIYTDILLHILEYYILKELGFTDVDIIRKKLTIDGEMRPKH